MQRPDLVDELPAAQYRAGENIVVAGEILGAALQHQIDPEFERPLVDGRAEGAVDEGKDLMLSGDFDKLDQIEKVKIGIRRRFGENETGVRPDRPVERPK